MKRMFERSGFLSRGVKNLSAREAYRLCNAGAVIIDVREEHLRNFRIFDVPHLISLPFSRLETDYYSLPVNKCLIFADTSGLKSKESIDYIKGKGFEMLANLAGGLIDWERDGLPVRINKNERLSGSCMCQLKTREVRVRDKKGSKT